MRRAKKINQIRHVLNPRVLVNSATGFGLHAGFKCINFFLKKQSIFASIPVQLMH